MAAGLHRNPDHLRKPTSALDKEMRRRLWFAATEFELQASFNRGMVSAPWPQQSDCPPANNIHDADMDQSTETLPALRSLGEFTSTSYLVTANETFSLRYTLNTMLNNIRQTITFDDTKRYTDEIEAHLQALPQWIGTTCEAPQALLSITLRQYLLVLHDRQFRLAISHAERNFSKLVLADTAAKIINSHKLIDAGKQSTCNSKRGTKESQQRVRIFRVCLLSPTSLVGSRHSVAHHVNRQSIPEHQGIL